MKPNILEIQHLGKPLLINADKYRANHKIIQALSESEYAGEYKALAPNWKKDIWLALLQRVDFSAFVTQNINYSQTIQSALDVVLGESEHPEKAELEKLLFDLGGQLIQYAGDLPERPGESETQIDATTLLGVIGRIFERIDKLLNRVLKQ
jgi:hypothetical protein